MQTTLPRVTTALAALLLLALLTACGGGGDDDDRHDTEPVDCKANPEQCK